MRYIMDNAGRMVPMPDEVDTTDMLSPVRCTWCGEVYDVGEVTVTAHPVTLHARVEVLR